jgi:two-component system chemotaxis sensor kinase CheA
MTPLLEQFLSESRDFLQGIAEKLMLLEGAPADKELMNELFRLVHTFKGNSGLFQFPELTNVLHAGEDLLDAIRNDQGAFSREHADRLLDAMDFVSMLCDEIETDEAIGTSESADSIRLAESLRRIIPATPEKQVPTPGANSIAASVARPVDHGGIDSWTIDSIPEAARMGAYRDSENEGLFLVTYTPKEGCFYQGDDPFYLAQRTPNLVWGGISSREPWPKLGELDAYRCVLVFRILTTAFREELLEHYRYVLEQVQIVQVCPLTLALPKGDLNGGPIYEDFVSEALGYLDEGRVPTLETAAKAMLELSNPDLWLSSALRWLLMVIEKEPGNIPALKALVESLDGLQPPHWKEIVAGNGDTGVPPGLRLVPASILPSLDPAFSESAKGIVAIQKGILGLSDGAPWQPGRIRAAAATISACLKAHGNLDPLESLEVALTAALAANSGAPLVAWLDGHSDLTAGVEKQGSTPAALALQGTPPSSSDQAAGTEPVMRQVEGELKYGRRAEDSPNGPKSLKVDQVKVDRLMNLIGEMVVSKNALPYLAGRAENVFGVRDLSREIKAQYAVINRIAEEMQDAIMQVRMMPVSFVFQRFPRLVRDTSRKLGKEVALVLDGEDTEADKNIIEALGDPLVHIVRNSLDHGFELPEARRSAGKPAAGTLTIRASQESDRVLIEIRDDGKGIDPDIIKRKAYEKGLIDEATLDRLTDQEALNLVFAPGLSTATVVSDLSGRGVGMDVVRTAVDKVNGSIHLESELGKGTRICLSLPLSMAVTNVMIIESDGQVFGIPMDCVVETVRVPQSRIMTIKKSQATVLRGRIVALKSLNSILGISTPPVANADGELAVLVVRVGEESIGLLVDNFRETVDVILKPMVGILSGLSVYAGSALMGDGSVLMVLNIKGVM